MNLLPVLPVALALFVQSAAIGVAVAQAALGTKPSVESAYVGALRKLGPILLVSIYYALVMMGGFILLVVAAMTVFGDIHVPYVGPLLRTLPSMITASLRPIALMVEYLAARDAEPPAA